MAKDRKRKRSRSRSDDRKRGREEDKKWQGMQKQLDNLTKVVEMLASRELNKDQENKKPEDNQKDSTPDREALEQSASDEDNQQEETADEKVLEILQVPPTKIQPEETKKETLSLDSEVLKILGEDPNVKPENSVELHTEIKNRWKAWMKEGLSDEIKKNLLKKYPRKGDLYTEPPKINLEIMGALAEVTKKRDQHFVEIQEQVGTAIIAVGSAMSILLKDPDEEVDELKLLECLSDAGKVLAETFHQHSAARKAYITPVMKKSVKSLVDSIHSEEWLYGDKLADQIKEARTIESACQSLNGTDKTPKRPFSSSQAQGNWKGPSAPYRQAGPVNHRKFSRFKLRNQSRRGQISSREKSRDSKDLSKK
ncbi:uncharacterized protein LOC141530713 [Cotesia typhae]|uniref:uncharacterized protein LOC141530713 n=1 Tax=Cotesia typhae TaxID=2053667 RepID=UPI003D68C5CA